MRQLEAPLALLDRSGERAPLVSEELGLDDGVGQLEKKLKQKGLYSNTLFVFLIDNGWCNGSFLSKNPCWACGGWITHL